MTAFKIAFEKVKELSDRFEAQFSYFTSPKYQESEVRKDFIDKFFIALGWDVNHDRQHNPYQQEVKVEKSQKQQQAVSQKRADYAFFLEPDYKNVKFFVEAKKPAGNLKNADDYFQTNRYAWNAGIGVSVLTDFEEFHIIDCRLKPDINQVFNAHHKYFHFSDYRNEERFKEIFWTFSYEAIQSGNLEEYVERLPKPRGGAKQTTLFGGRYQSIDESFLEYIDDIRLNLAKAFKKNNESLNSEMLTEAVQRTIDRLVFIRFLEDKLIEPENYVSEFGNRNSPWKDFLTTCRRLDVKYNGVVFKRHFIDDQEFSEMADKLFGSICRDFSHLNTPYDFNAIPIHILGSIYERFLGKVVVAKPKRVTIEEKLEVRKAGGVYYTPKYIVDYIVSNTVGKKIKDKSPKEISKLKFADIACGSGSFLISVLESLFDYHIKYYNQNPLDAEKDKCHKIGNAYALTIKQKQKILLNNIYGVDLDHQATEVTQLSLYLKMLEDETTATANEMQVLFHEKILPDLSNNIKCGNSLIGLDIMRGQLFEDDELKKFNPMNFEAAFPAISNNGFDVIVGNPPYGAELSKIEREYLLKKFPFGNTDTAALFMLTAHLLLKNKGKVGFIIPKSFTYASNWKKARAYLLSDLNEIVDCSKVWKEVKLEMSIYISQKKSNTEFFDSLIRAGESFLNIGKISKKICSDFDFIVNGVTSTEIDIALKIKETGKVLNDYVTNQRGGMFQNLVKEKGDYKVLGGKQIGRYNLANDVKRYIDKEDIVDEKCLIKRESILAQNIVAHVMNPKPHIIIIATIPESNDKLVILDTVNQLNNISELNTKCILGILNSKLISWYTYKFVFANAIRTMHFDSITTNRIPFPNINLKDRSQKAKHDDMVELVTQRLQVQKKILIAKTDRDMGHLLNQKQGLENSIDQLVGRLFGLNINEMNNII